MRRQRDDPGGSRASGHEVVALTDASLVTGGGWAAVPPVAEVADRLGAWAGHRRTIPGDLFTGAIEGRDVSVTTLVVTRLFETRTEEPVVATLPPTRLPVYDGPVGRVDV